MSVEAPDLQFGLERQLPNRQSDIETQGHPGDWCIPAGDKIRKTV